MIYLLWQMELLAIVNTLNRHGTMQLAMDALVQSVCPVRQCSNCEERQGDYREQTKACDLGTNDGTILGLHLECRRLGAHPAAGLRR